MMESSPNPKPAASRGCRERRKRGPKTTYTFRVAPKPTPNPSWIQYTSSKGEKSWLEMRTSGDLPDPEVVESIPTTENIQKRQEEPAPLPSNYDGSKLLKFCNLAQEICPSGTAIPVTSPLPTQRITTSTSSNGVPSDLHPTMGQEVMLALGILAVMFLTLSASRFWSWLCKRNSVDNKESKVIFRRLCELRPRETGTSDRKEDPEKTIKTEGKLADILDERLSLSQPITFIFCQIMVLILNNFVGLFVCTSFGFGREEEQK
ncbi:hypothetical protein ONS96_001029 [Cadophora gregata f. sp. sojae]|nr:hypothetical protein ONS96_001029 [Cadophora gregata f. sp. sojae]